VSEFVDWYRGKLVQKVDEEPLFYQNGQPVMAIQPWIRCEEGEWLPATPENFNPNNLEGRASNHECRRHSAEYRKTKKRRLLEREAAQLRAKAEEIERELADEF
jgi:hypothetical protein